MIYHIPERHETSNQFWSPLSCVGTMVQNPVRTRVELRRRFHDIHAIALVSTFIIGTGIYLGPTGVLQRITSPGLALIVWTIMGFVGIVDGIVYAEYATVFPRCGCSYLYLELFYGPAIGFLRLWMYFISRPGADAIKCLLAATWVTSYDHGVLIRRPFYCFFIKSFQYRKHINLLWGWLLHKRPVVRKTCVYLYISMNLVKGGSDNNICI